MELSFNFGEVNCALGLKWVRLSSSKVGKEIRQEAKLYGTKIGVKRLIKDEDGNRQQVGFSVTGSSKGLVSGAAVLAELSDNAVVLQSINKSKYWVCAIARKEVLPGYDEVLNKEDAIRIAGEAMDLMAEEGVEYELIVDPASNELINNISQHPQSFSDYLAETVIPGSVLKASKIGVITTNPLLLAGLGVGVIAGGALFYTSQNPGAQNDLGGAPLIAPSKIKKANQRPVAEILAEAKEEEKQWLSQDLSGYDVSSAANVMANYVENIPSVIAGWTLKSTSWSADSNTISTKWEVREGSTALILKQATGRDNITFTKKGTEASIIDRFDVEKNVVEADQLDEYFSGQQYKELHLNHELTRLGLDFSTKQDKALEKRPKPIKDLAKDPNAKIRQYKVDITTFKVSGDGMVNFLEATNALDKLKGFVPKDIEFSSNERLNWEINGVIYAR